MLLSYEYGLTSTPLNRTQLYYYKVADSTESYLVYLLYIGTFNLKNFFVKVFMNFESYSVYSFSYPLFSSFNASNGYLNSVVSPNLNVWGAFEYFRLS